MKVRSLTKFVFLSILFGLLFSNSTFIFGPGVSTTAPMAPYLNGIFPDLVPNLTDSSIAYTVENAFPNLTFIDPVRLIETDSNEMMVLGKVGKVWKFPNDSMSVDSNKTLVLDISNQTVDGVDGGAVGLILHPEFGINSSPHKRDFFVWYRYTPAKGTYGNYGYMRLSRFTIEEGVDTVDLASEYVLIQQFDRHDWHNGGAMFFGNDGFLYISVGDEGGSNDVYNVSQQIDKWLFGGVLRIDVMMDSTRSHPIRRQPQNQVSPPNGWPNSFTQGYLIPNDNPWVAADSSNLEEFYAIGLRSPHSMYYDTLTGNIWVADVGQGKREEISVITGDSFNLQWPYKEGEIDNPNGMTPSTIIGIQLPPFHSYERSFGQCVIGGFIYRGSKYDSLVGKYIFSDHEVQSIWSLTTGVSPSVEFLLNVPSEGQGTKDGISGFSLGNDGTIYILDLYGTGLNGGKIHKLVINDNIVPNPPDSLSQLGVFTDLQNLTPIPGIIPYQTNAPLWSDRAYKQRWIALPNNGGANGVHDLPSEKIRFDDEENWDFPAGTVMIKHFELPINENDSSITKKLETRFVVFAKDGSAYGLTYKWNDAGTEAILLNDADTSIITVQNKTGGTYQQTWDFPSRQQCLDCHTENAGYALGIKTRQLNDDYYYESTGLTSNQIETWNHLGMFDQDINNFDQLPQSISIWNDMASEEFKVRSYIDGNCSYCHRPNGVSGAFNAMSKKALYDQHLILEPVISNASTTNGVIINPSDTSTSELWIRDASITDIAMPPLAKNIVDDEYIAILSSWISGLESNNPTTIQTGYYFLKARHSDKFLAPSNGSDVTNTGIVQQDSLDIAYQKWYIEPIGNLKYRITNTFSDKVLAITNMLGTRGEKIVQQEWNAKHNQMWYFESVDSNYFKLKSAYNGLILDIFGATLVPGGNTITWTDHNGANQNFLLVPTSGPVTACQNPVTTYLFELDWEGEATTGSGSVRKNLAVSGNTMTIGGSTYSQGIGTHAASEITYHLNGKYEKFLSDIGVDDNTCSQGDVDFLVYLDEELAFHSDSLTSGLPITQADNAFNFELNVIGINYLRLVVTDGGDNITCDHANWANARLESCIPKDCISLDSMYLSNLTYNSNVINGNGLPSLDLDNDGNALNIGGTTYSKGIGTTTYSEITYDLNGQFGSFKTDLGVQNNSTCDESVVFEIYLDDVLSYQSAPIFANFSPEAVELNVIGTQQLKLTATHLSGGNCLANWGDSKLFYCTDENLGIFTHNDDIGSVGISGSSFHVEGLYNLNGSGEGFTNGGDEFQFLSKDQVGDGEILGKVLNFSNALSNSKMGLIWRSSMLSSDVFVMVAQLPNGDLELLWRETSSGNINSSGAIPISNSYDYVFLKLKRLNNTFFAYYSTTSQEGPWISLNGSPVMLSNLASSAKIGLAVTSSDDGFTALGQFESVSVLQSIDPKPIYLKIKALLSGPFNSGQGLMTTALRDQNLIPGHQPYNAFPWYYGGSECVDEVPTPIVDWVLVQLRDKNDSSAVITERACFIEPNGNLLDLDGSNRIYFGEWPIDSAYISIMHRNHLGLMTDNLHPLYQ